MTTVASLGKLSSVRTQVSRLIERRDFWQGIATGGSQESVFDQNMLYETGHWTGAEIYFLDGLNAGITAMVNGSDVGVIMFPALSNAVAAGVHYEVRKFHTKADVDDGIAGAVKDAWNQVWVPQQWALTITNPYPGGVSVMNTPPTTSPDMLPSAYPFVYTLRIEDPRAYALPSGLVYLNSVQYLDDANPPVLHTMRNNHWFSRQDGNLYIDAGAWPSMAQTTIPLTLNGYRAPLIPVLDTDIIEVPTTYVIWQAAGMLKLQGYGSQSIDVGDEAHDAATLMQIAAAKLAQSRTYMKPNARRMVS
jgi:hypothetical protein